jgi:hypothetical protein
MEEGYSTNSKNITLVYRSFHEEQFILNVANGDTVESLKSKICDKDGLISFSFAALS